MQIEVISKTDDGKKVRLKLTDINTTVIEAIIHGLNSNKNVVYARYIVEHPDLVDPFLELQIKDGTYQEALLQAAADFKDYFSTIDE